MIRTKITTDSGTVYEFESDSAHETRALLEVFGDKSQPAEKPKVKYAAKTKGRSSARWTLKELGIVFDAANESLESKGKLSPAAIVDYCIKSLPARSRSSILNRAYDVTLALEGRRGASPAAKSYARKFLAFKSPKVEEATTPAATTNWMGRKVPQEA